MMFFKDHNPPHFHAKYEGKIAVFNIKSARKVAGDLPPQAKRLIKEWAIKHQKELLENWERAQKDGKLRSIKPLE